MESIKIPRCINRSSLCDLLGWTQQVAEPRPILFPEILISGNGEILFILTKKIANLSVNQPKNGQFFAQKSNSNNNNSVMLVHYNQAFTKSFFEKKFITD